MKRVFPIIILQCLLLGCSGDDGGNPITNFLFPVSHDVQLGAQLKYEIESNPTEYPILDSVQYPEAYYHLYRLRDSILNTGAVTHADDFSWELKIIHDDNVLNAFAAPGGYIYVYTGLIKYLDTEDQLAGVMGMK